MCDEKNEYTFFQQDGATAYTANNWMSTLHNIFGDWIISYPLWPAFSRDMMPYDYYLWGCFKDNIYKQITEHTHTEDYVKEIMSHSISNF
jgi:hypothetical protein